MTSRLARRAPPVAAGSSVMATGIVSIGLSDAGRDSLSLAFFAAGALGWLVVVVPLLAVLCRDRALLSADDPAALTTVAATAVLGQRAVALGSVDIGDAALVLGTCLWAPLTWGLVRARRPRAKGSWFMVAVAAESVAALAAVAARHQHAPWLAAAAVAAWAFGLAGYGWALAGFDLRELHAGRGDHWVAGGALAIAALAGADAAAALHGLHRVLEIAATAVWATAAGWLAVLVAAELHRPRMEYDIRRWATVFPLGMYAASASRLAGVDGVSAFASFARWWIWVAVAAWTVVLAGAAVSARGTASQQRRQATQP